MDQLLNQISATPPVRTLIGVALIVLITVLGAAVLRWILFSFVARFTRRSGTSLDDRLLMAGRGYFRLLIYLFGLSVMSDFLEARYVDEVGKRLFEVADGIMFSLAVILVAVLVLKIISTILTWYSNVIASRTDTQLDDEFVPLADRTIKIVLLMLAALVILDKYGVDIKGLITVLGVGSLAVALAAQETLANMIGGFTIMIDRPFRKGDMVTLADGRRVIVQEIGVRSTKFLTYDNTLVIVPNAELIKATIHNITYPEPEVRIVIDVGVSYSSDMDLVKRSMLEEAAAHPKTLDKPEPEFYFLNFGDSSLDTSLRCYVRNALDVREVASDLRHRILERFRKEGIEIPFPQRVITMVDDDNVAKEDAPRD